MRTLFTLLFIVSLTGLLSAQGNTEQSLAFQYFQDGEFDKAAGLFEKLYSKDPSSPLLYRYLYNSLLYSKDYEKLEGIIKKNLKKNSEDLDYQVDLGNLYIQQGNVSKGKEEFGKVIKALQPSGKQITQVANAFLNYNEQQLAAKTYERGRELMGNSNIYSLELASLYEKLNDPKNAIGYYLTYLDNNPGDIQTVRNNLQATILQKDFSEEFRTQLLLRVQKFPQEVTYAELLIWFYSQKGDFKGAIIQAKALDKRLRENAYRLVNIARIASNEKDYDAAGEAYQYVIEKGPANPFYMQAKQELLKTYRDKITNSISYTQEELLNLDKEYDKFIAEFGINRNTATTIKEKAELKAFFLNNYEEAISLLDNMLHNPQIDKKLKAEFKLELGDFYIMKGEVWEATLLYSQVDKDFGDEPIGEVARFKNAKLSYYRGEFEWSQAQLNILKGSTSELIANDALQLSVFIMDNLGLDTTLYPMEKFAKADLLFYQNKLDLALLNLDTVINIFPNHSLADDVYFMKAKIFIKRHDYETAKSYLEKVITKFSDELLGDDATFALAELYQTRFNDSEKAKQLYQDLIFKYKDSIYIVEARKRFRQLRGDQL